MVIVTIEGVRLLVFYRHYSHVRGQVIGVYRHYRGVLLVFIVTIEGVRLLVFIVTIGVFLSSL